MPSLNGHAALVTGATSEIGAATCRVLARQGVRVALHDGGAPEAAMAIASAIAAEGGTAVVVASDMGDAAAVQRMVEAAHRALGALDILVNAHALPASGLLLSLTAEDWQRSMATNVHGAFWATQAAARFMLLARRGRIVNVLAPPPGRGQLAQAAANGALQALTRALAQELASKQVTVNAVAPGLLEGQLRGGPGQPDPERLREQVPLGRFGTAEDVAELVAFLASDAASYITGETLAVDGGQGGRR